MIFKIFISVLIALLSTVMAAAQQSVARQWNEILLESIRNDFARPTVHARNLFHISAAMYDGWAAFQPEANTYFLGNILGEYSIPFGGIDAGNEIKTAQEEAMSYAAYRIINHRFINSPGHLETLRISSELMYELGYDPNFSSTDYTGGNAAALGNYIASKVIGFGLQDGSNEQNDYENTFYLPVNSPMILTLPGSQNLSDPNRWQPLAFNTFVDQSGNVVSAGTPEFLSPEWGNVVPFSLQEKDRKVVSRDDLDFWIYHDPGMPCLTNTEGNDSFKDYEWGFALVSIWSSHLDASDEVNCDISPATIGNIDFEDFPKTLAEFKSFYDRIDGGDISKGHQINPRTGMPYEPQWVPRGDYARVLAEFWADGPDSETPPGHWFTILNYVNDHPLLVKKMGGQGPEVDDLEWDIKSYFLLGGAMHDVAISAWSIKGYYDFIRPISAIRHMASLGQSSQENLPNYHPAGIKLVEGFIEQISSDDALAGENLENINKIKLYAWRGHEYINDAATDVAGVGWILAENWWPYQRPNFVTPPFAGYVSGHSTFSRAAAKVLTLMTGDEYFPGGIGEFVAKKNEFLVFEKGPSTDVVLQWATYYDASNECSLSRIWGGIHPPVDDMPGRKIGDVIGENAFDFATSFFKKDVVSGFDLSHQKGFLLYPNPVEQGSQLRIEIKNKKSASKIRILSQAGTILKEFNIANGSNHHMVINTDQLPTGLYILQILEKERLSSRLVLIK